MAISEDDKFIVEAALSRVSDLNRALFSYRIMYFSIIAGYFTALSFVSTIASKSGFLSFGDSYALILMLLTVSALVGVSVILFFDFTHQELIENALAAVEEVEMTSSEFEGKRAIARPSAPFHSLYINTSIFLFYFIPAFFLYSFSYYISAQVNEPDFSLRLSEILQENCFVEFLQDGNGLIIDKLYDPICMNDFGEFAFSEDLSNSIVFAFFISTSMAAIFIVVSFHRIVGRFINCVCREKYNPNAVCSTRSRATNVWKIRFDRSMNYILIFVLSLALATFVSLLLSDGILNRLKTLLYGS